jgi:hypothetical protein
MNRLWLSSSTRLMVRTFPNGTVYRTAGQTCVHNHTRHLWLEEHTVIAGVYPHYLFITCRYLTINIILMHTWALLLADVDLASRETLIFGCTTNDRLPLRLARNCTQMDMDLRPSNASTDRINAILEPYVAK